MWIDIDTTDFWDFTVYSKSYIYFTLSNVLWKTFIDPVYDRLIVLIKNWTRANILTIEKRWKGLYILVLEYILAFFRLWGRKQILCSFEESSLSSEDLPEEEEDRHIAARGSTWIERWFETNRKTPESAALTKGVRDLQGPSEATL